jgi:hypothetical protein
MVKQKLYYIGYVIGTGAIFGTCLRLLTQPNTGWPGIALIGAGLGLALFIIFLKTKSMTERKAPRLWRPLRKRLEDLVAIFLDPVGLVGVVPLLLLFLSPFWLAGLLAAMAIYLFDLITQAAIPARLGWIASGTVSGAGVALILVGLHKLLSQLGYRILWWL